MDDDLVERLAIRCARGNNGGEWSTHYTEDQKIVWRRLVRELIAKWEESRLKPCPFCGGTNLRVQTEHEEIPAGAMGIGSSSGSVPHEVIWCHSCGTFPHGVKWWNRRALGRPTTDD